MKLDTSNQNKGLEFLRIKKVATLSELTTHLQCSPQTVKRRLAEWKAITSYNQNGKFYTLPDTPTFDANGLWRYEGVSFSRFGNLPKTFAGLLGNSHAGLTGAEAGALLGLVPGSFLWSVREHPAIRREKHQGLYIYFPSEPVSYEKQRARRERMSKAGLPKDFEAIAILVEKIKHPEFSNEELSQRLKKQKISVAPEGIENLFLKHGLGEKKTLHSV